MLRELGQVPRPQTSAGAGVNQFEELPLTSAKGRTTTKKPRERPAFFDVTNERSVSGEGQKPSSPIQNLTKDFETSHVRSREHRPRIDAVPVRQINRCTKGWTPATCLTLHAGGD